MKPTPFTWGHFFRLVFSATVAACVAAVVGSAGLNQKQQPKPIVEMATEGKELFYKVAGDDKWYKVYERTDFPNAD